MSAGTITVFAAMLALGACAPPVEQGNAPGNADLSAPPIAPTLPAPGSPAGLPDDRAPLNEPKGPIDPKSVEAAGQVVQLYGALLEQRKFAEAERQWGDADGAKAFSAGLRQYSELHVQVGKPGDSEGGAGSIFVTVPVVFYGQGAAGAFNRKAEVNLRRVNDVDGSTAEQRRWHIANIAWSPAS